MPVVWSDRHRLHEPGGEVWVGVRTPGTELPARAERIREALAEAGARFVDARRRSPTTPCSPSTTRSCSAYLADAWEEWEAAGLTVDPGQDRVVPYLFPHPGLLSDRPPAIPTAITARAGQFAYDTMTLIGPGHLGGGARRGRRGAHRGRPRARPASAPPTPAAGRRATTPPAPASAAPAT